MTLFKLQITKKNKTSLSKLTTKIFFDMTCTSKI